MVSKHGYVHDKEWDLQLKMKILKITFEKVDKNSHE
jgi:hypothetical protein